MPDDDMGAPVNITNETFQKLAKKWGKNEREAKEMVLKALDENNLNDDMKIMFEDASKAWGQELVEAEKETQKMLQKELNLKN